MTVFFISRHAGAIEWLEAEGIPVDRHVSHLDPDEVQPGDWVIGTLPVNLAAAVCARGARFFYLAMDLPPERRGQELSPAEMRAYGAQLQEFRVQRLDPSDV